MKIVRAKTNNAVFYLLPDDEKAVIDSHGLVADSVRALDIRPTTHEIVSGISAPEHWVAGGVLELQW